MTPEELIELQKMITTAAGVIETKLAASLNKQMEGINNKVDAMAGVASGFQESLTALPALIRQEAENQLNANLPGIMESQLKASLPGIVAEVGNQFEAKVKAMAGGDNSPGVGVTMGSLLANSDKIVGIVNAFRQPTTEAAMISQFGLIMKWHALLSKLEKGGGTPDEITKRITETFATPTQE